MDILAIDLGKTRSLACWYRTDDTQEFRTVPTRPRDFHADARADVRDRLMPSPPHTVAAATIIQDV